MKFARLAILGLALCLGAIPGCANVISLAGAPEPAGYVLGSAGLLLILAGRFLKRRR